MADTIRILGDVAWTANDWPVDCVNLITDGYVDAAGNLIANQNGCLSTDGENYVTQGVIPLHSNGPSQTLAGTSATVNGIGNWGVQVKNAAGFTNLDPQPPAFFGQCTPSPPTSLNVSNATDYELDLTWTAPARIGGQAITDYIIRYTTGGSTYTVNTGSTSASYTLASLQGGEDYEISVAAINSVGVGAYSTPIAATVSGVPIAGIVPNTDSIARFYLPASATSISVNTNTSSGYAKLHVAGTGTYSSVSQNSQHHPQYYGSANVSLTGLSTSAAKVIELISCDSNGNQSGYIHGLDVGSASSNSIEGIDISGLSQLNFFSCAGTNVAANTYIFYGYFSPSSSPTITEIRAVNVTQTTGSAGNVHVPYHHPHRYYGSGGFFLNGQNLDAAALDQFYTDLATAVVSGSGIFVGGNPGVSGDSPSIATAKNYTVFGS